MTEHEHEWEPLGVGRRCLVCGLEEFVLEPWQQEIVAKAGRRLVAITPRRPDAQLRRLYAAVKRAIDGNFDGKPPQ